MPEEGPNRPDVPPDGDDLRRDGRPSGDVQNDDSPASDSRTRRDVLAAAGAATLGGALSTLSASDAAAGRTIPDPIRDASGFAVEQSGDTSVFPHGVASGGPTPSGVLLWTRVDPDAVDGETPLGVEVAEDESFERPVFSGTVPAEAFGPDRDYTVTVDADGELDADGRYAYRFVYDGATSEVGWCRTLPEPEASPESLRLAIASCNHYLHGYFGAFGHVAEADVDYLVHLGDFIYEGAGDGVGDRRIDLPSGEEQAHDLSDYRHLYRTYRSDEDLRRALRSHTLIHVWDDHEIVNDRWWNYETDAPETYSHPQGGDPEFMRRLYVDAIRAYTEYVPARIQFGPSDGEAPAPDALHEEVRLYRSLQFGDLAELFLTDERLYRSSPPGAGDPDPAVAAETAVEDPGRTMLGRDQRRWLLDGLTGSDAGWKLWGNEVLASALRFVDDGEARVNADAWDGYRTERRRVLSDLADAGVENVVALTGDLHSYLAASLLTDYDLAPRSASSEREGESNRDGESDTDGGLGGDADEPDRVGVEFTAPAISSDNLVAAGTLPDSDMIVAGLQAENPHIEWFDSSHWGYATVAVTRDELVYSAYAVDRAAADPASDLLRRYRVSAGGTEMERLDGGGSPSVGGDVDG